CQHYYSTPSRF
nr:immunoglobulin light chain junction region [Macaca mulatta]